MNNEFMLTDNLERVIELLKEMENIESIFIIGGAQIYKKALSKETSQCTFKRLIDLFYDSILKCNQDLDRIFCTKFRFS